MNGSVFFFPWERIFYEVLVFVKSFVRGARASVGGAADISESSSDEAGELSFFCWGKYRNNCIRGLWGLRFFSRVRNSERVLAQLSKGIEISLAQLFVWVSR